MHMLHKIIFKCSTECLPHDGAESISINREKHFSQAATCQGTRIEWRINNGLFYL